MTATPSPLRLLDYVLTVTATVVLIVGMRAVTGSFPPLWTCLAFGGASAAAVAVGAAIARRRARDE